jgi:hypothetical protein
MHKQLVIFIGILPNLLFGQYTYFNQGYLPPYPEMGSGESIYLFLKNDSLLTYGLAPSPDDDGQGYDLVRYTYLLNDQGQVLNLTNIQSGDEFIYMNYSDNISRVENGYVASAGNDFNPLIIWYDNNFEEIQRTEIASLNSDTTSAILYHNTIEASGDVISVGRVTYDLDPDLPGQDYANLFITKHDPLGNQIWLRQFDQFSLNITEDLSSFFVRPNGAIFQLNNEDILIFCSIGFDYDCYAIKFTSEGEYVDHVKWGNPTYSEGSPWPVQIGDSTFKFVFGSYSTGMGEVLASHPIVGTLNANDMTVSLYPVIDHDYYYGLITDFERTPDGGYAILYYGTTDPNVNARAFLVKTNEQGIEEWYKEFAPPEEYDTPTAYDLEITSDGGFAFVGNYHPHAGDVYYYKTWVVKTDACGELIDTGCPPTIGTDEITMKELVKIQVFPNPTANLLHVKTSATGIAQAALVDITGRIVWRTNANLYDVEFTWNLDALPPSLYELVLFDANGMRIASTPVIKAN